MAELAGLIISGVGLVALESTIEDIFSKISTWKRHGQEYEELNLELEMVILAYERWHKTVLFADPTRSMDLPDLPNANERETETVERLLGAIELAFKEVEKTSRRYERENDAPPPMEVKEKMSQLEIMAAKVRAANRARQTGTGPADKLRWVFHDKKALETLIQKVAKNVKQLVELFPGTTREIQKGLATLELSNFVPAGAMDVLEEHHQLVQILDAAKKVDPVLKATTDESIKKVEQRHSYRNARTSGKARMLNGDEIAAGYSASGPGNSYDNMSATEESRMHNGDRIGLSTNFLDD